MKRKRIPTSWADDSWADNTYTVWSDDLTSNPMVNPFVANKNGNFTSSALTPAQQMLVHLAQQNQTTTVSIWNPVATSSSVSKYHPTPSVTSIGNSVYVNNIAIDNNGMQTSTGGGDSKNVYVYQGTEKTIHLPDKSRIEIKADGSYEVIDKDAKVTYRASRIKDFNPFLNASDKLEEFIAHCGSVGVRQSEVLRLPLELFIAWLIISAARKDDMPAPDLPLDTNLKRKAMPRCTGCGRFLGRALRQRSLEFCAPRCYGLHQTRALAAPPRPSALVPVAVAA